MWLEIGLVILTLFLALYRWITRNFGKWEALGSGEFLKDHYPVKHLELDIVMHFYILGYGEF